MRLLLAFLLAASAFAQTAPAPAAAQQPAAAPAAAAQQPAAAPAPPAPAAGAQQPAAAPAPAKAEAAAESPAPATEPNFTGSIDLGYRWLSNGGNFQEFRSVLDLRQGPEVLGLDFTLLDPKKRLFDSVNVRAYGWGGEPYNTANLEARKLGIYDFSFDYRNIAYFNAVPSFANPLAPAGFNEQMFDLRRRNLSANLNLLPGKHISPYLALDRNSGHGNGIDTWVQDSNNEYAVPTLLRDRTENFRGGVRFEYNRFHVTLEQGGTTYRNDDQASQTGGVNLGDNTMPVLGQTLALTGLVQAYGIRGDSIYSKALVTANPTSWLNLYGQFLFSQPKTTVNYSDIATGNFLMISSLLFYSGEQTIGTGAANQPHTTANAGFEMRPSRRVRIVESLTTDRYHDAASPIVAEQLLLQSAKGPVINTALNYSQYVNYNQQSIDAFVDVSRRITLHGGYRYVWGEAQVLAGQLSQSGTLVPGQLQRNIGVAGLSYRTTSKLWINLDYEGASSDHIYFRTSLNDYNKARARVRYQANAALAIQANFQVLNNQNPDPTIRYDFQSRDNALSVYWTPKGGKRISVMAEYDRSTLRSNISYLDLPFLNPATSAYRDNAHTATSAVDIALPGLTGAKLTFGGSVFLSSGSRPSNYYQPLARLSLPLVKHLYWNTEWQYYGFGEAFYLYEGFRTHTLVTGLRLVR